MEQSIIYVKSSTGEPLMPTRRHNKVWYWLRKGLARVVRREKRRTRRARNTRYRKARFDNRQRPQGWLPPSIYSSFATQKLANPEISGVLYQQGELFGYCIR